MPIAADRTRVSQPGRLVRDLHRLGGERPRTLLAFARSLGKRAGGRDLGANTPAGHRSPAAARRPRASRAAACRRCVRRGRSRSAAPSSAAWRLRPRRAGRQYRSENRATTILKPHQQLVMWHPKRVTLSHLQGGTAVLDQVRAGLDRSPRPARVELRCASCGYGVTVRVAPDRCPMCGGSVWEHAPRQRPRA